MYQADQIQSMINELDRVLRRTGRWRLWTLFTQLHDQRQMLERVRNFLLMQQRSDRTATPELAPIAPQALMRPLPPPHLHPDSVKLEVAALMAQRDALREEVKFLSALAQTPDPKTSASNSALAPTLVPTLAPDTRQIEQLSALHDRTDFLLSSMDSSLQMAFTSMQKNVEVYQTTLHQGLDRMHNLGYQGEVLFSALINHLAQQMGRELAANPVNSVTNPATNPATNPVTNSAINLTTAFPNYSTAQDVPPIHRPLDSSTPKPTRSTPATEPSPSPQPETAVRFSPETALGDREMTLDTLFGSPFDETSNEMSNEMSDKTSSDIFGETFGDTLNDAFGDFGGSSSDSGLDFARTNAPLGSEVNNDITLEEMNALFADIPSLKS